MLKRAPFIMIPLAVLLFAVSIWAATTGKIAGEITDLETDEPLIGVNVQVFDDSDELVSGAATDFDGRYFILNIRPGMYKVKASYVGYNFVTQTNVIVQTDRTSTIDFELEQSVIKSKEIIITAVKKQVELDVTTSTSTTTAEQIENMPVNSVEDILQVKAGIVEHQGQLHMRGGRAREVAYMVDGMPVTDPTYGYQGLQVSTSSIQEITVQTGSYNAEYGGALSGIVNLVTREGDPNNFSGSANFMTDDLGFGVLNKWSNNSDKLEVTLSGPEPFSGYLLPLVGVKIPKAKRISYFLSVTGENSDTRLPYNYLWDNDEHLPTDNEIITPYKIDYNWFGFFPERRYNQYNFTLKLKQRLSPSINYTITGTGNWVKARSWDWGFTYTPETAHIQERKAYQLSFKWTHTLSPKTFYEIRAGYLYTSLDYLPGGLTPDDFAIDSSTWGSLDDWVDLNGDGVAQVRVKWWDANENGQWDFWEYWEPLVDRVDTVWGNSEHTEIGYLDTVYIDDRPPMLGEEPWYEVNDNDVFEPRQTNWNSYLSASPLDRTEPFVDGEPYRDGMPYGMGFYGELLRGMAVIKDDTMWVDLNDNGAVEMGEYVWGTYFYNDPLVSASMCIALEETTWNDWNDNDQADWGEYTDVNSDGTYTTRNGICDFIDANGNGEYDINEEGEPFIDLNGNGIYDPDNYIRDDWEPYIDVNGNGKWDDTDGFLDRGFDRYAHWHRRETNVIMGKADITSQVDDNNQMKSGLEFQFINMNMSEIQYPEFKYDREYDGQLYEKHGIFRSFYERSPKQFAWYLQDKMEYGGLIANIGLRLDVFMQAGEVLEDSVSQDLIEVLPDYDEIYKSQSRLSPRLGMSYPITDRSKLFFSYAHLYQLPGYDNFYQTPTQASRAGRLLGNPNLGYEKTVIYELGVAYGVTEDWTLEFSGYYKDIYGLLNTTHTQIGPLEQDVYENLDYARSRGVEFTVRKGYSNRYTLEANYQYAFAYGKSSSDRSGYDALFDQSAIPLQDLPLNWDERHQVSLVADYRVRKDDHPIVFGMKIPDQWGLNMIFQYGSGFPYTPDIRNPNWTPEPGEKSWERENALRMPQHYNIDLRFNKDFNFKSLDYSFFFLISNLTNRRNVESVYSQTGEPDDPYIEDYGEDVVYDFAQNPTHWSSPRNIRVGLEIRW
ncbi:TonB-dependent receptor [bacterium]|nr:TonB-dependent receptor [bacterium]